MFCSCESILIVSSNLKKTNPNGAIFGLFFPIADTTLWQGKRNVTFGRLIWRLCKHSNAFFSCSGHTQRSLFIYWIDWFVWLNYILLLMPVTRYPLAIRIINITIIMLFRREQCGGSGGGVVDFFYIYNVVLCCFLMSDPITHAHTHWLTFPDFNRQFTHSPFHSLYLHFTIALVPPFYTLALSTINQITIDVCVYECMYCSMYYFKL